MWAELKSSFKGCLHARRLRGLPESLPEFGKLTGRRRARLLETHDGDTIKVAIVEGGKAQQFTVRVLGVDTPEVRSKDPAEKAAGIRARNFVAGWALPDRFSVDGVYSEQELKAAYADTPVMLEVDFKGTDKYGRGLASVYKPGCGTSLSDLLIANGHAVEYGGRKPVFGSA
jgi:endonuclease YncB( thermonuclease family)